MGRLGVRRGFFVLAYGFPYCSVERILRIYADSLRAVRGCLFLALNCGFFAASRMMGFFTTALVLLRKYI